MTGAPFSDLVVRPERPGEISAIYDLTRRAFAPMPFSGGDEQDIINARRDAYALAISLVAEADGSLVGHAAFSPAFAADGSQGWFSLGPISVEPALQRQGIGTALIAKGVERLRVDGRRRLCSRRRHATLRITDATASNNFPD
jgi:putative acetyltransferase